VVQIEGMLTRQGAVSAAPFGSASILPISWMYIRTPIGPIPGPPPPCGMQNVLCRLRCETSAPI
jgi:hypothetical protein